VELPLRDALDVAVAEFGSRVSEVPSGAWGRPTPCVDWDVSYLVAHVVGGNRFAALVLDGMSSDDALARIMSERQLRGPSPSQDFLESAAEQGRQFDHPGRLDATVSHPLGDLPGSRFLALRVFDISIHAWDLASSIGADPTLDEHLVDTVLDIVEHEPPGMGFGITPLGRAGPAATPQDRLLDLTGRRAR